MRILTRDRVLFTGHDRRPLTKGLMLPAAFPTLLRSFPWTH
jgi:hypothetical protein